MSGLITQQELCTVLSKKIDDSDSNSKLSKQQIGVLTSLKTNSKDSLVNAINELYNNTINGKKLIGQAITQKGVSASGNDTYQVLANKINNIKVGYTKEEIIANGIASRYKVEVVSEQALNANGYGTGNFHEVLHDKDRDERDHGSQVTCLKRRKDNYNALMMYYTTGNGYRDYSGVYYLQYMDFASFKLTSNGSESKLYDSTAALYESIPREGTLDYGQLITNPTRSTTDSYNGTTTTTTKCMFRLKTPVTTYDLVEIPNAGYIFSTNGNTFTTVVEKYENSKYVQYKTVYRVIAELVDANGNVIG